MNSLKRLFPYLRPYRTPILLGALMAVTNNGVAALGPWLLKLAVDRLEKSITPRELAFFALLIVLVALVAGVLRFYLRKVLIGVSRHVELDLRNNCSRICSDCPPRSTTAIARATFMARHDQRSRKRALGARAGHHVPDGHDHAWRCLSLSMMIILARG